MKRAVQVVETDEVAGFEAMLGESVLLMCGVYFYAGKLTGVNGDHLELEEAKLVYETGAWDSPAWADAQSLPSPWRVMKQSVESWGKAKC